MTRKTPTKMTSRTAPRARSRATAKAKPKTPQLVGLLVSGGVHAIAPVSHEPVTAIHDWQLVLVVGSDGLRTRHLVGRANCEGRVSSPIVAIDAKDRIARTQSGRQYQLVGESGFDWDADYVLHAWLRGTRTTVVRHSSTALERLFNRHATQH